MECAPGDDAGRSTFAVAAHRKTHQCRFSECRFDSARQHHDARAGYPAGAAFPGGIGERAIAVVAPGVDCNAGARGGQKTSYAESRALRAAADSACARSSTCSLERLILPKAAADC